MIYFQRNQNKEKKKHLHINRWKCN